MKLKNYWKRFWTLDRHHAAGFTLVELIVVIAILAILAGVGIPVYSGYITKANKQADMTLVSEVKQALSLAMYSDPFEEIPVGKLALTNNGAVLYDSTGTVVALENTEIEAALKKAFGDNYQDILKLKYDGWTVAAHVAGLTFFEAGIVDSSSYLSGSRSEMLLQDVEKFTSMAANLSEAMTGSPLAADMTLAKLYGNDLLDDTAAKYGIEVDAKYKDVDGNINWDTWGSENSQEFSNMLVLAAALDNDLYMAGLESGEFHETSAATNLIQTFSTYYAFAAICPEFSPILDQYLDAMTAEGPTTINGVTVNPVNTPSDGSVWYSKLNDAVANFETSDGMSYADYIAEDGPYGSVAEEDQFAFSYILGSLSNVTPEDIADDLSNANLFTDGAVKGKYDQYMDAVEAASGFMPGENEGNTAYNDGEIAIIFNQNQLIVKEII